MLTFDGHRDVAKIIDFGLGAIRRMEDVEEEWLSEVRWVGAVGKTTLVGLWGMFMKKPPPPPPPTKQRVCSVYMQKW